jgi:hypothetical protein
MRKPSLPAVVVLTLLASASAAAWAAANKASVAHYTPPAQPGLIYTVINYNRVAGRAQHTLVSVSWGQYQDALVVAPPYAANLCATSSPAGIVFRIRNHGSSAPLTLTTNGTIVRGPYQGEIPMELLQACYSLVL